jgi:signal transduction histidine kinase
MVNGALLEEGRQPEISFAHTALGIAPEDLPRIFDRFYRGESTRNAGSTGLGLSIVKQLVEVQGGQVSAASVLGEGTTIRFTLPVALEANEAKGVQSTSVMEPAKIGVSSRIDASSSNV